jgi:drug/metabolite transporter (DMT)-like permease
VSQLAALVPLVLATALIGDPAPSAGAIAWGLAAGMAGLLGLSAFYRGLAVGTMSIVAPIAATGAVVPVVVGLVADGERPGAAQVAGLAFALVGVVLAAREPERAGAAARSGRAALGLALVAAAGFGVTLVALERSTAAAGVPWAMLIARGLEIVVLIAAACVLRPAPPSGARAWRALVVVGLFDVSANALFAVATTQGLLSIVSVLASLYPAATVLLARTMLHERVSRTQEAGVLVILAGVVAISAG